MSDVLFRYLLTARRREKSTWRRLLLADDPLLEAGVEQLVETAAARVEVTSQHERVTLEKVTVPASRRRTVRFYEVAQPRRPRDGHFERRTEKFPLRDTLQVYTCPSCRGSGRVRCRRCSGRGNVRCSPCGGSGRTEGPDGKRRRCGSCGGSGRRRCGNCRGSGKVTCSDCRGEGRLASWDVEVYRWLIEERAEDELPLPAEESRVRRAFHGWLEIDPERVPAFEPETVADHLGFETSRALEVAAGIDVYRRRLEDEARGSGDRYLFHRTQRSIAPVGYTVVRLAGKARFYWLVGRGGEAKEVTPPGRPDAVKCLGWLGIPSGGATAWSVFDHAFELALPVLEIFHGVSPEWLAGGTAASWGLALAATRRVRRRPPPVPAIGLIAADGRPTAFLTCLAYLGSYLGRLTVLDRAYDLQSRRLLGRMRPKRQSESLGLALTNGRRLRLIEVANPDNLSPERFRLMARALDAVMILETPDRAAADLRARLADAAPSLQVGTLAIDDHPDPGGSGVALPLEAVRRAFVEDLAGEVAWDALYERMWRPLAALAETTSGAGRAAEELG